MFRPISSIFLIISAFLIQGCDSGTQSTEPAGEPSAAASEAAPEDAAPSLDDILAGAHRGENAARDNWRHPKETLEFFGLTPNMSVVEIWPGGGWYTEILAPYLNENGQYYAANWDPESEIEFLREGVARFQKKLDANPELYGNTQMTVLMPPDAMEMAPPGSADMIVTFRNIHNWMPRGTAPTMFSAMFTALKPGGVLGVVEHRGDAAVEQDPAAKTGYVNEDYAIALAEAAGFVLEERSEINANPADTKDYAEGVWSLPPTLRAGEEETYLAIGESDRFTLRFRKPQS